MYEIDFLPVESENGSGGKSGDAIAMRFDDDLTRAQRVLVIDGGFKDTGNRLVEHIQHHYKTSHVDLMISTHPDVDHINGLAGAMEALTVGELMLHQPRLHAGGVSDFSNIEAVDNLIATANAKRVPITEPFAGKSRFNGQIRILGPTEGYYKELVHQHLDEVHQGLVGSASIAASHLLSMNADLLNRALAGFPDETLTDEGETGPRNNTSVITLLRADGCRLLFTGDAGIPALEFAAAEYEAVHGSFGAFPLRFMQAPHHGSKRNLGPTILNRLLGSPGAPHGRPSAFISSAKASRKHPSPKVVNALSRRGASVCATEGRTISLSNGAPLRPGWASMTPLPPLAEDEDDN